MDAEELIERMCIAAVEMDANAKFVWDSPNAKDARRAFRRGMRAAFEVANAEFQKEILERDWSGR